MALNTTYLESNGTDITYPIPSEPSYVPPDVPEPQIPSPGSVPYIPRPLFTSNLTLRIYRNSSDNRKLNKSLSNMITYNISLKEVTDLLNPSIVIESETDLTTYNYGYIVELGRYYYINAKQLANNIMYRLDMKQDHLMTYKNDILRLVCIIDKQEELVNDLLDDGSYVSQVNDFTNRYEFSTGFTDDPTNVLICAGGGQNMFSGGAISTVDSSHISIKSSQENVEPGNKIYITADADSGYAVDSITVHVDVPGGSTFDITDTKTLFGQYVYECGSEYPITVTVTEKTV